jgi:maltooligosyltrehalose trehalohydrolase
VRVHPDPYARDFQGVQRGLSRLYVDPENGEEVDYYRLSSAARAYLNGKYGDPEKAPLAEREWAWRASRVEFMRFEVQPEPHIDISESYVILRDESGKALSRDELLARLGACDPRLPEALHSKLRGGLYDDLWSRNVDESGRIRMKNEGGAWVTLVNNLSQLVGLHYEFQVWGSDRASGTRLVSNPSGCPTPRGQAALHCNDPWDDHIVELSGISVRGGLVTDPTYAWKNDSVPRPPPDEWVVYQLHVGSFLGAAQNGRRSTFGDILRRIEYFKSLGVNTIAFMPFNEFEGTRDWGYQGAQTLAIASAYGFVDDDGRFVKGSEAVKRLIDALHGAGMNAIGDVVYNHIHGLESILREYDSKYDPYFNWNRDRRGRIEYRITPWGMMPAYNNPSVYQYFVDHAVALADELHLDGERFDFTEPIKNGNGGGGAYGWFMLREMNRQLHFLNPQIFTVAENFPYELSASEPSYRDGSGGMGFDALWYTEPQHRLVHDYNPAHPGVIQAAAAGQPTDVDGLMQMLLNHPGVPRWSKALFMLSNHDEVGNAARTVSVAFGRSRDLEWARAAARLVTMYFFTPGIPYFFQGEESLATNAHRWGVPSTWDLGWSWIELGPNWPWDQIQFNAQIEQRCRRLAALSPEQRSASDEYRRLSPTERIICDHLVSVSPASIDGVIQDIYRRLHFHCFVDAIALRKRSQVFRPDAVIQPLYQHNDHGALAFSVSWKNQCYVVIANVSRRNLFNYGINLPDGQFQEVFNTNSAFYGGSGEGNGGRTIRRGVPITIPAASCLVFARR